LACKGNGHDWLCNNSPNLLSTKVTDLNGNTITSAEQGQTIKLCAKVEGIGWFSCSNFSLHFYLHGNPGGWYIDCYEDRVASGTIWWVCIEHTISEAHQPGSHEFNVIEALTNRALAINLEIIPIYQCEDYTNGNDCIYAGCYWWNNSCHSSPPPSCESINNQTECVQAGCYWYNDSCHGSPECSDGDLKCVGYDLYECQNGQWVFIEENSPTCGYVPPECSPDGITKCVGYDLYKCQNGQWILIEQNSETCGYPNGNGDECSQHTSQSTCEAAGCHWYAYPNPLGEASCHDKEIMMAYLPFIIAGVGGVILLLALVTPKAAPAPPLRSPNGRYHG